MGFLKDLKANYTVSAMLCTVLGIVLTIWPGTSTEVVCMVLGGVLLIFGLVQILIYVFTKDRTVVNQIMLITGIIFAVIGVWIILSPTMIIKIIPIIIGVYILFNGIQNAVQGYKLCQSKYEKWWVAFVIGLVTVILGLVLIFNPFEAVTTLVRVIGIFLIIDGFSDMWILGSLSKVKRQADKIIDVEAVEEDEK